MVFFLQKGRIGKKNLNNFKSDKKFDCSSLKEFVNSLLAMAQIRMYVFEKTRKRCKKKRENAVNSGMILTMEPCISKFCSTCSFIKMASS